MGGGPLAAQESARGGAPTRLWVLARWGRGATLPPPRSGGSPGSCSLDLGPPYADDQSACSQPPPPRGDKVQGQGPGDVPPEARRVPPGQDHHPQEAQLGSAE